MANKKKGYGKLTRREFLKAAGLAAAGGLLSTCAPAPTPTPRTPATPAPGTPVPRVEGATPEERALNGIKALKAAGKIKNGDTFVILHHSGQRNNIVPALEEWNRLTGLNFVSAEEGLEANIYTKVMNEAVTRTGSYDIFLTFVNWIADMAEAGLIVDQTEWWEKYDPEVDHGPNAYVSPIDRFTSLYKGRRYAMGADNDTFSMFYRKDLMENPDEQKRFEDKFGRKLEVPRTWEEFDQWVAFFDRPDQGIRGVHMYAERYFAYTGWAARFISRGGAYFDDNMDPLITSEEGVTALEEMVRLIQNHAWPDAVTGDWSVAYTRFPEGSVFCAWAWPSLGKWAQDPKTSKIVGKVGAMEIPGTMHDGELIRAVPHVVGWSFSISRYSKSPEACYCFIQWFCGPKTGLDAIARVGTLDIFRQSWFNEPKMKEAYGADFLPVLLANSKNAFPDISLRGANEYLDKLNLHLQQAFAGQKKPEQALKDAADEWQKITDRLGRLSQIEAWRQERKNYPEPIQRLWRKKGLFKD
ncbi:ABC transporter substrate-binding protein [Thermoflexus sp.]|uniref:ABC transporter substrate-binding protein n=1 Tax=Thermoflexus sp. TaxID=1969742 RepID=UPI001774404D|nr:extracellular solute-binding protein [Thermoflexus sp.]